MLLLKNYFKLVTFRFRHLYLKKNRRFLTGFVLVLLLPVYFFIQAAGLFHAWSELTPANSSLIFNAMGSVLWGLFFFLFLSAIPVTMHFYFLSGDMDLLLSSPIKKSTIFRFKLFVTTLSNSMVFYIIGLPFLMAAGYALRLSFFYYMAALAGGFVFLFVPTGLSTLFSLVLVRVSSARRLKNVSVILTGLVFIALWTGVQLVRLERFHPLSGRFEKDALGTIPPVVDTPAWSFWPSNWLSRGLYGFAGGDFYPAAFHFLLLLAAAGGIFYLSALTIQRQYEKGVARTYDIMKRDRKNRGSFRRTAPVWSVVVRDYKLLVRDSRLLTMLFFYIAMMVVFPLVLGTIPLLSGTPLPQEFLKMLMFCSIMAAGITARLVPMEGLSFYYNRFLPLRAVTLITAKALLCIFFSLGCTVAAVILLNFVVDSETVLYFYVLGLALFVLLGAVGLGLFFGVCFARFDWEHPKQMLKGSGFMYLTLAAVAFWLLCMQVMAFFAGNMAAGFFWVGVLGTVFYITGNIVSLKKLEYLEWT